MKFKVSIIVLDHFHLNLSKDQYLTIVDQLESLFNYFMYNLVYCKILVLITVTTNL